MACHDRRQARNTASERTRAAEEGLFLPGCSAHVGIRGSLYTPDDLSQDAGMGFKVFSCPEIDDIVAQAVVERLREQVGDRPTYYRIACGAGPGAGPDARTLIEMPIHWGLDDWEQYAYLPGVSGSGLIESPAKALEMWLLELAAMHACGGHFVLTAHPFLSGRPSRAAALERLIERMRSLDGLWIASLDEVAAYAESLNLPARRLSPPQLPPA